MYPTAPSFLYFCIYLLSNCSGELRSYFIPLSIFSCLRSLNNKMIALAISSLKFWECKARTPNSHSVSDTWDIKPNESSSSPHPPLSPLSGFSSSFSFFLFLFFFPPPPPFPKLLLLNFLSWILYLNLNLHTVSASLFPSKIWWGYKYTGIYV